MTFTVCHIGDQTFRFAKLFTDDLNDINVCHFVVATYIVNFAYTSFVDDQVDRAAVILYIQPVTYIFTLSVNRKWLVI